MKAKKAATEKDLHQHKCQCGNLWEHSAKKCFDDTKAHTCTKCGREVWHKYHGDDLRNAMSAVIGEILHGHNLRKETAQ